MCRRAEIARKLAEEYHAAFIPLQEMFDEACRVQPAAYWVPDGVHPSCAGNQLIARAWIDAFHKLEKKERQYRTIRWQRRRCLVRHLLLADFSIYIQ